MGIINNLFGKRPTLETLEQYLNKRRQALHNDGRDVQRRCRILVVDDQVESDNYPFKEELRLLKESGRYNITTKTDLDSLNDAAGYDLIICDNQGIGLKMCGSKGNGISLLKLLTHEYPGKRYVLFSNKEIKINRLESFAKLSAKIAVWDKDVLAKSYNDNGEGGLSDHIRREIERTLNPIVRWQEIRRSFVVNTNMSLRDVADIEEAYINSIIKNKPEIYERASSKICAGNEDSHIASYLKATKSVIDFTVTILSII